MAGSGFGGDRKSVNTDLNLVPFIDLLSTLICFLLITAVWSQISALSTNGANTSSDPNNPAQPTEKKVQFSITILLNRVELSEDQKISLVPHMGVDPDYPTILRYLQDWKTRYPDRSDLVIYSDSQVPYKHLIKLMDTTVEGRFDDVGVNTN